MVSHQYKCIFVHVRRTGGKSIEFALGGIRLLDRDGNPTSIWDNAIHRGGKTTYKLCHRLHYVHDTAVGIRAQFPDEFASYFKFSFVRNPWEQMLSLFFRLNDTKELSVSAFHQFITDYNRLGGTVPRRSLFDESGQCLVNYIGRFERLEEDFAEACRLMKADGIRLPHHNACAHGDYRSYYDDATAQRVNDLFQEDIKEFGYAF